MLTVTAITPKGSKEGGNHLAYLLAVEYLRDEHGHEITASTWAGSLTEKLGLQAGQEADPEVMKLLADGYGPEGKHQKLRNSAGNGRSGHDLTFSPPKPVSEAMGLAFAEGDQEMVAKIIEASRKAVEATLKQAEEWKLLEVKRGKDGVHRHASEGLLASVHTHLANRNLEPDLHHHVLLFNVGFAEGKWGGNETDVLCSHTTALDKLYLAETVKNLQQLGFGVEKKYGVDGLGNQTGIDSFTLTGMPDYLCEKHSTRRQEVLAYKEAHPGAKDAALKTRKHKDEPTLHEMADAWKEDFKLFEQEKPGLVPKVRDLLGRESNIKPINDEEMFDKLHRNEAVITRNTLVARIAMERPDLGIAGVTRELDRIDKHPEIVHIQPEHSQGKKLFPSLRHTLGRWSTKGMVQMEQDTLALAVSHAQDQAHTLDRQSLNDRMDAFEKKQQDTKPGFAMTDEQRKAVLHATTEDGAVKIIQGRAGVGKTTTSKVIVDAYKDQGYQVLGASTSWRAAQQLSVDSGVNGMALAKLLKQVEKGDLKLDSKTLLVVDEAGMVDTKTSYEAMTKVIQAGGKVIAMGDFHQLQAVGAGGMMRSLIDKVGCAEVNTIRRQKNQADRDTAQELYTGYKQKRGTRDPRQAAALGRKVFERMDKAGQIDRHESAGDAVKAMAKDYIKNPDRPEDKLVLGLDNASVKALNKAIREERKQAGELGMREVMVTSRTRLGVEQLAMVKGDRIQFKERLRGGLADNGELGTLLKVSKDRFGVATFEVKMDTPDAKGKERIVRFNEVDTQAITHGYAVTNHSAQGLTVKHVQMLGNAKMMDQHAALVGFTRQTDSFKLYLDKDDEQDIQRRMGTQRLKAVAVEEGVTHKAPSPSPFERLLNLFKKPKPEATPKLPEAETPTPKPKRGVTL
ncbi:MAG: hypothetical protein B7X39_14110 [Lysobacterales bacterium 14-68-21]|jgi:conjugative relaxase-like TrwC/TraI family protein|nr:MAG: hypothetical protein B7X45_13000 [Xanthomonadales bacterium 15-68-25]OZB65380.1 MAG: hypothetical protein B7X39_14110 [Xanthomonadales bacterium 14-68-21]